MKLLKTEEYDLFHRYTYEDHSTMTVFTDQIVYFNHPTRVVLQREGLQFYHQKIDGTQINETPDLSRMSESELFQASLALQTEIDINRLIIIQTQMNKISEDYE
ncbi:TPA: hypothetical protein J6O31_002956 [Escherichia coli]|uniref:hypothetical protein n=1 Tax=Escherichia coli TaxID=562 RepID=UPI00077502DE|nr:hypothetical protein [Escherichia coli]EEW7495340.1 hypothetical protein [Escherichia albertii]EEX4920950.1 hypothetical protein [Escherichia albertii]EFC4784199.1 hypothetical protein [Escherichia coli]EFD0481465.1 hypothetical protein [Escherichia coli]EFH5363503.1 hypothetical protein [Escherichia coli]